MTVATLPKHDDVLIVLENIRWSTYEAILEDISPHRGMRIFYDEGRLEIMTTSPPHESWKCLLGRFVETLTLTLDIPIHSLGQTTWKRALLKKGFEPDECYYIQNVDLVEDPRELDVEDAPPLDLSVEVDLTSSSLPRERIYAAFGLREIWRHNRERVGIRVLGDDGVYHDAERSVAFPFVTPADLNRFLAMASSMNETAILRKFQEWVSEVGAADQSDE